MRRYFDILGIDPAATNEEIRRAYLDLAKVWHPDRFGGDERLRKIAEEKLKEVNEAYEALLARPEPVLPAYQPVQTPPPPVRQRHAIWWIVLASSSGIAAMLYLAIRLMDRTAAPAVAGRAEVKVEAPIRVAGPAVHSAGAPPVRDENALGEFRLQNEADRECVVRVFSKDKTGGALRTVSLLAREEVGLDGLAPGIYRLAVAYGDDKEYWMGPFDFYQTQDSKERSGLRYRITLRPK